MAKKIVKRRGYQFQIHVRKTRPLEVVGPCPVNCKSPHSLHISFITRTQKRYEDSSSNLLGVEQETTGMKTICVDRRICFKRYQQPNYYIKFSLLLKSLNVLADFHDNISSKIMSMGESKYKNGKKVKKKIYNGIHVDLTRIKTFIGDRDSVRELLEKEMAECGVEPSDKGVHFVL